MAQHSKEFAVTTVLVSAVIIIPPLLVAVWMGSLSVPGIQHFPVESDLIIEMAVNKLDPLTLVVKVTSNSTDASLTLSKARITDHNKTVIAECIGQWVGKHEVVQGIRVNDGYYRPICRLQDFGS